MMDTLTIQRIRNFLDLTFQKHIDLSDRLKDSEPERDRQFLTRSLAAFCLCSLTDCEPAAAAAAITDGFNDEGLDAIYFDAPDKTLYLVQAKWSSSGSKTIDPDEVSRFLSGVRRLIQYPAADFSVFNEKIRKRESEIRALLLRSDVRVALVLAVTSPHPLPKPAQDRMDEFIAKQNNADDEVFVLNRFDLKKIYGRLTGSFDAKINLQLELREWGSLPKPKAFYGQALVSQIAALSTWGKPLFAKNIRYFRGATDVNQGIEKTLAERPELFWYLNNGITILCKSVEKTLGGLDSHDFGVFNCTGASVVNGAQTCGVIWELAKRGHLSVSDQQAKVHVRLVSLENSPEDFETDLTRATNTQNRIQHRDYAALDPQQQRLAREMSMDGRVYAYKSGDLDPEGRDGCNIEEATVALACANPDISLAVRAKREIGQLWQDIYSTPYTTLFNADLSSRSMWRAVLIMREVDRALRAGDKTSVPRGDMVAVHGSRFILHRVFLDPVIKQYKNPQRSEDELLLQARLAAEKVLADVSAVVEKLFPESYLANVFKNFEKNREVDCELSKPPERPPVAPQIEMFVLDPENDTTGPE
ncbi:MAG TPA: AIPR family protein [Candidatus Limnocylindrales bacterium]|nr:AIPR family protein [Candidatus Limnocylindrales bacterium]